VIRFEISNRSSGSAAHYHALPFLAGLIVVGVSYIRLFVLLAELRPTVGVPRAVQPLDRCVENGDNWKYYEAPGPECRLSPPFSYMVPLRNWLPAQL
jgi:hypothetical protein